MLYILLVIWVIGWHVGLYGIFKKMGENPLHALIPFYNMWIVTKRCKIEKWLFWVQFIPIIGQCVSLWMAIIITIHFKKYTLLEHTLACALSPIYLPYLGFNSSDKWHGEKAFLLYKKSPLRDWVDALIFAVVAASIIRSFVFEAYVIPTGSMEKTLLINDFLFVSKINYGPRLPITPISVPLVHNTMPWSATTPSYIKTIQFPYMRLPAIEAVKRNDVVVFNFPAGDTIINHPDFGSKIPYYDVLRQKFDGNRDALMAEFPIIVHPYDKTDNYIKRCVAEAGDTLEVRRGVVYINGKKSEVPSGSQMEYDVLLKSPLTTEFIEKELGIKITNDDEHQGRYNKEEDYIEYDSTALRCRINMPEDRAAALRKSGLAVEIYAKLSTGIDPNLFPYDTLHTKNNVDNFV